MVMVLRRRQQRTTLPQRRQTPLAIERTPDAICDLQPAGHIAQHFGHVGIDPGER